MKTLRVVAAVLVGAAVVWVGQQVVAHETGEKHEHDQPAMQQPSPEQMQQMIADMMKLMQPGENHKRLEPMVGKWDAAMKSWWSGPSGPAAETKGTCENRWVLDGRFVMTEIKCDMMMPDASGKPTPVPFQGMGLTGYDNYRNLYVGSWMDSMGTQMLAFKGAADPSGKVFTYYGDMDEPMLKVVGRTVKYVWRVVDNDKHIFEMYDLHAGDGYKVMEITYTRQKPSGSTGN